MPAPSVPGSHATTKALEASISGVIHIGRPAKKIATTGMPLCLRPSRSARSWFGVFALAERDGFGSGVGSPLGGPPEPSAPAFGGGGGPPYGAGNGARRGIEGGGVPHHPPYGVCPGPAIA